MSETRNYPIFKLLSFSGGFVILIALFLLNSCSTFKTVEPIFISQTRTILNEKEKFGEPFGVVFHDGAMFYSDGETGKIWRVSRLDDSSFYNVFNLVTDKLNTPSQIALDKNGDLIVTDSGSQTIKKVKTSNGDIEIIAGVENRRGYADGDAKTALFNAPIGVAVAGDKIYVADTYNDKIRVIENGRVSTVAGSDQGYADAENGLSAKFDTPCGLAIWQNNLIVADLKNHRIRVVEPNGKTWTLAGNNLDDSIDGFLNQASFVAPIAVTVNKFGLIYVADGDAIRVVGRRLFPTVETITAKKRGYADGELTASGFNRPSGLAFDANGNLFVADAENQSLRVMTDEKTAEKIPSVISENLRVSAEEFRQLQPPRWTYDPPERRREIAGTLGEIRGEIVDETSQAWFHNGLDIVGGYGEMARFVRTEKVLLPLATENFATLRELVRMPTLGYIHIRLGRDQNNKIFDDARFQFSRDENGKLKNVRIPRGAKFEAGEAIGTLNPMNHVHLIAGRSNAEMNALDALILPGVSDKIAPVIEQVFLFDEKWQAIGETKNPNARINLAGKTRIVVRAFDRMDGNAERRRLGVYKIGYQILRENETPISDITWTISFERLPNAEAVKFVYAAGSKSGATGETIFKYIASNRVLGDSFKEDFFDAEKLETGTYILRVFAADFFGNQTSKDLNFTR